mgnify:CR=1 FL=1
MSYNNGAIETEYIDPVSFTTSRCAFELNPNRLGILPNMRIINLGVTNNTGVSVYSRGLGAVSVLKNLRLLDGRTELSCLRNIAPYLQFKNLNKENAINKSNDSYLKRNRLGFEINGLDNDVEHLYDPGSSTTVADGNSATAYLDLRLLLPLLNNIPALPTAVFKNLRLELEFHTNNTTDQMIVNNNYTTEAMRPVLAYDYVSDPRILNPLTEQLRNGVQWNEVEWDNYVVPEVALGSDIVQVQTAANQSLGFIDKRVGRLVLIKTLANPALEVSGNLVLGLGGTAASQAVNLQTLQVRLNGKNVFPGANGVNRPNEMQGIVVDAYGDMQAYPGSNLYQWNQVSTLLKPAEMSGQAAYAACAVNARVADMQVIFQRTNNQDSSTKSATNDALQINLYAEIAKVITFNDAEYSVMYM